MSFRALMAWLRRRPPVPKSVPALDRLSLALNHNHVCPDCGGSLFQPGPEGRVSIDIRCKECGSKFCYCPPFPPQRIINDDGLYSQIAVPLSKL